MIVVRRAQWGSIRAVSLIAGGELSIFSQVLDFDQMLGAVVDQSFDSLFEMFFLAACRLNVDQRIGPCHRCYLHLSIFDFINL